MLKYIIKRLIYMIPVLLGVLSIVFILSKVTPGDPVNQIVGTDAEPEVKEAMRHELFLDRPIYVQYGHYLWKVVTKLDLGTSYVTKQPVSKELLGRFPTTLKLALATIVVSLLIGIPLGVISAVKQYSWIDNLTMTISMLGVSIPTFWFALMAILLFAVKLEWLPASGVRTPAGWILPIAMLGIHAAGIFSRITRSSMLEVIRQDYIRTARSKGQKESKIIFRHALQNALIPVLAVVGNHLAATMGGSMIAETIFAIPGVGKYMIDNIMARNYPAIQGGVVFIALACSIIMLIMDLVYTYADPRLKSEFAKKNNIKKRSVKAKEAV